MSTNSEMSPVNVAPGVHIRRDEETGIEYVGSEKALVAGGYAEAEWFVDLGGFSRLIARVPGGRFIVVGEGKGNRLTNQHKENGAFTVGRNRDGNYSVFAYHHPDEYRKRKALAEAERNARYAAWEAERAEKEQKETWVLAKEAHTAGDYPTRWKDGVLYHLQQVENLITGRLVFSDIPDVRLFGNDIAEASAAAAALRRVLQNTRPKIKDRVQVSNVVSLSAHAYRNMKRG